MENNKIRLKWLSKYLARCCIRAKPGDEDSMQVGSGDSPHGSGKSHFGKIGVYSLLCFSLAGLLAGFAFGGFLAHPPRGSAASAGATSSTPVISGRNPNLSATATPKDVFPGDPIVGAGDYTSPEKADGTTSYTFSAQVVNKTSNTPITATDVTCRLWLTDDANAMKAALSANNYAIPSTIASFNQPFPHEVAGALAFKSSSQQTQPCSATGKTTWTYTISPTVQPGNYFLAVLSDWKGAHYNWYMVAVKISNGNAGGN